MMSRCLIGVLCGSMLLLAPIGASAQQSSSAVVVSVQRRDPDGNVRQETAALDPARTAIVVVDMWDRHWCTTYTARVANLVPRMNETLRAARTLGIQVVFAPSDVVDFYREAPQRRAMQAVPEHPEPQKEDGVAPPPPGPTDFCECGPSRPCQNRACWTRQQPDLQIADQDLIGDCNNGRELLNLCGERNIDTLVYMGVASNMCLQYRSMGLRNMRSYGLRVFVVADLVEAISSNGLDADGKPNANFTPAAGTARVQASLEQHLAPTLESRQLLEAAGLQPRPDDHRPHVVLIAAESEYHSQDTLATFAKTFLDAEFHCTLLAATGAEGSGRDDIPGLAALYDADVLVLSMRRRSLPVTEMDHLERFIRAGKPLVVLRTSAAAFQTRQDPQPGYVVWDRFDREVLGCNYQGYNPQSRETGCDVWIATEAADHPILQGVATTFHSPAWLYRQRPLANTTQVLLWGRWSAEDPDEPVAWTNTHAGGRVFYTTLGHPDDFNNEAFQHLLLNAIRWVSQRESKTGANP